MTRNQDTGSRSMAKNILTTKFMYKIKEACKVSGVLEQLFVAKLLLGGLQQVTGMVFQKKFGPVIFFLS